MERPIHRVRGCCRPQEPPPPIVHAAPQSWRDPLSRRRPQVGPRQEGGESRLAGAGAATSAPNARAHRSMGARQARASGFCSPPGRLGHLRCGYLLARPVPAAARRPPLPSRRRAPPLAPSARPGPPDVGLAPPQPCGPEEAGPPGAGPAPAPARLPIGGRGHGLRFLPPWLGQPGQPPGPRLSSPSPSTPAPCPRSAIPPSSAPLCGLSHSQSPGLPISRSHWSAAAPTIGRRYLSISCESSTPPGRRMLRLHWVFVEVWVGPER